MEGTLHEAATDNVFLPTYHDVSKVIQTNFYKCTQLLDFFM